MDLSHKVNVVQDSIRKICSRAFIPLYNGDECELYNEYRLNIAIVFGEGQQLDDGHTIKTPNLDFARLIAQLYTIQMDLCKSDMTKNAHVYLNIYEALSRVQVFLVTSNNVNSKHEITDLFTLKEESVYVPDGECFGEGNLTKLGCYVDGRIYLWVDRICKYAHNKLIFQIVLLHEIIHLLFDVMRKSSHKTKDKDKEEQMDNFLVLHCYAHALYQLAEVKDFIWNSIIDFIANQPLEYRAEKLFHENENWYSAKKELFEFLSLTKTK